MTTGASIIPYSIMSRISPPMVIRSSCRRLSMYSRTGSLPRMFVIEYVHAAIYNIAYLLFYCKRRVQSGEIISADLKKINFKVKGFWVGWRPSFQILSQILLGVPPQSGVASPFFPAEREKRTIIRIPWRSPPGSRALREPVAAALRRRRGRLPWSTATGGLTTFQPPPSVPANATSTY